MSNAMCTTRYFLTALKSLPVLAALFYLPGLAIAQDEGSDTTGTEKAETSIELVFTESNNHNKLLSATVKTKIDDSYQPVSGIEVHFYQTEVNPEQLLGIATSNKKGIAVLLVPEEKMDKSTPEYTFIAAVENNEQFEDNQEEISAAESDFEMTLETEDSVRMVHISLQAPDATGALAPVAEAEVHLYVQRMVGLLPISDDPETTDENGEVSAEFPGDIPGDEDGNLIIVAKVEDHERYGNLEFRRKVKWGVPLVIDPDRDRRQLWSSRANAPLYLIFIVNAMLIGIWGVIAYIVFNIFQIRKLGRQPA